MRIQLQHVVSCAQLKHETNDANHTMLTRATELCEVCRAMIDESRVRIEQIKKAFLPFASQVEQMSETSFAGALLDAFGVLGFHKVFENEGSGFAAACASCARPASTVGSSAQWLFYAKPL